MKIGLLTVYSFNYGSFYQAKALQKQLQDMGHECELINEEFKKNEWKNLFLLYTFHKVVPAFCRPLICKILPQYNTFLKLQKDVSTLPQSPASMRKMEEISKRYDCIVLGSDELWSANPGSIRFTPAYFGYGITCPHIAYAPSATLFDIEDEALCEKAREGMNSYYSIAVRDVHSKNVVKKVTGRDVPVVLDPTLLNPFFAQKEDELVKGEYILVYGQHYDEEQRELIKKTSEAYGMKIFALGWPQDFADGFLNPETAEEFQQAFVKAAYSFPSTFHGTIFSILHRRPFVSMLNPLRGGKVKMLLEQLQLTDRIYQSGHAEITQQKIDYDVIFDRLADLRKESLQYLENALKMVNVVSEHNCCGCQACTAVCPVQAIRMKEDEEGFLYPVVDEKLCVHCGLCKNNCPMNRQKQKRPESVYACRIKDEEQCRKSSSGGAFRLASDVVLKQNGVVAGAVFDEEFKVKTVLAQAKEQRDAMCGSKYVQSDMTGIYDKIKAALQDQKTVLFTGTPCQCAGVKAFAERNLGELSERLYLCDIVCHGTPSPRIWQEYLQWRKQQKHSDIRDITFRSKHFGWHKQSMKIDFVNGDTIRALTTQDPFYIMYFSHVCHRTSCHSCPFASYERVSDLTMGDFWGIEDMKAANGNVQEHLQKLQDEQGTSLVFVNTEKGRWLWEQMKQNADWYQSDLSSCYQAIFENPPKVSPKRKAFWETYRKDGFAVAVKQYGRLYTRDKIVKFVIAPVTKKLGIYNLAQKIYFGKK